MGVWVWGVGWEGGMGVETPPRNGLKKGVQTWVQMHGWASGVAPLFRPPTSAESVEHVGVLILLWLQRVPILWSLAGSTK